MRENRPSGSEGGGPEERPVSLPLSPVSNESRVSAHCAARLQAGFVRLQRRVTRGVQVPARPVPSGL